MRTYKTKTLGLSRDANRVLDIIGDYKGSLDIDILKKLVDEVEIKPENLQSILNVLVNRGLIDVTKGVIELR